MRSLLLLVAVGAAAAYTISFGLVEGPRGVPAFDVYCYYYPHILYALQRLADGGGGLLWNPYQNCGQPFFGITETGLLYPPNVFFLMLAPEAGLRAVLFTNLVIGGLGAYALGREIGASPIGAGAGALAFVLGGAAYDLTTWMPTVQAPYVWMPVAMLCCERLLKAPSLRVALLLAVALAAGLLPGHPQFVLFTCQLLALRLLWALFDAAERRHFWRALGGVGLAVTVMLLLTAVQFLPSLEVVGESVRHTTLHADEIAPRGLDTMARIAWLITTHSALAPFTLVPGCFAVVAIVGSRRRAALFYLVAGVFFFVLSFGESTPLGWLYYQLPLSSLFRLPMRFRFVTGFCAAIPIGLAVDALAEKRWPAVGVAAAALAGMAAWVGRLWPADWGLAAMLLAGAVLAAALPRARPVGVAVVVATIVLAPIVVPHWTTQRFLADDRPLHAHGGLFERLRARLTPLDRVQLAMPAQRDLGFQEKTGLLYQIRVTTDYETQMSQRYAEYSTMLRRSELLRNLNQVYNPGSWNPRTVSWPLVDLAAARYLVVNQPLEQGAVDPERLAQLRVIDADGDIRVYENHAALPRAYYVPQIAVVPDGDTRLQRLSRGREDRRHLALVNAEPPSGFLGVPGNQASADARFVVDEPERVVLEADAPERGFLFLADQFFPGWSATVNGAPAPILVGNHTFRLVEVPRGRVTVEFRYRSQRLWIGAAISGATLLVLAGVLIVPMWRGHGRPLHGNWGTS